ncbi:MAG: rane protein of unknown function, partial [Candidatus Saccharibacteria bacterium]|nr:rane protein of unknown function [Candidatus Saccharibacteria bacterium]
TIALTGGAAGGSIAALATLLFPVLVMAILSVLVALLILAARQALITVLVILSPLAFVLFLLPNTEKHFEKWRSTFTTMLMVFPMFSLLFGGSQLASYIIIQNTNQLSVVILALFVQAAPLALTPFLLQFSGSLLGKVAGMVNNPQKGLVDRSRNWSKDRADTLAKRKRAQNEGGNWLRRPTPGRIAYRRDMARRNREDRKKSYESQLDASWSGDERSKTIQTDMKTSELRQSTNKAVVERIFETQKQLTPELMAMAGTQRLEQAHVKQLQAAEGARWDEAMTGKVAGDASHPFGQFSAAANTVMREQNIADNNAAIAQALQKSEFANVLSKDIDLQIRAGGIGGEKGAIKVKAKAISAVVEAGIEDVKAIKTASDIKPGDIEEMSREFKKAVDTGDLASLRAHTDMLGSSKDAGINRLRELLIKHEDKIVGNTEIIETYRHHVNGNAEINQGAEDIGVWSRDAFDDPKTGKKAWRTMEEVGKDFITWKNMTSSSFAGMKASTQKIALTVKDPKTGRWAITDEIARDIMSSPVSRANLKEDVKPLMKARAEGRLRTDADGKLEEVWPVR